MGRQCIRNSFHTGKQLSVGFVYYCTKSQLRIQLALELRVQKPEVQNIVVQRIRLFSLKVFVWLLSGIAGTGAGLTGNGKIPAAAFLLEKLQSAVLKQCCEVMGHAVKEGYQSCKERVPLACYAQCIGTCFPQARLCATGKGKKKKSARVGIWTNASFVGDLYFKSYPGK